MESMILGIAAGTLTTISFIPQVIKIYKRKDASDISLLTFCVFSVGVMLWLIYGVVVHAWPIIIANAVTLALSCIIVAMKLIYKK